MPEAGSWQGSGTMKQDRTDRKPEAGSWQDAQTMKPGSGMPPCWLPDKAEAGKLDHAGSRKLAEFRNHEAGKWDAAMLDDR